MYMNYRCYQIILRVKHFDTNRERCEVLTGYLSLVWMNEYVTLDRKFYSLLFKQEVVAAPVISKFYSLSHSSRRPLLEMWQLYIAFYNIIVICINNNAIINNNYGRHQDLILFFKIPTCTQKTVWKRAIKSFANPVLKFPNFTRSSFWWE